MIIRDQVIKKILQAFKVHNIVCLLGSRQVGKTTLARYLWGVRGKTNKDPGYFDLERYGDLQALENPDLILPTLKGLVVIDEIQRKPSLFPYLRYLHDESLPQQFLLIGSASRELINQTSETLAGRIAYIDIYGFSMQEVHDWNHLWVKGGYPKAYLMEEQDSLFWREQFVRTYIEQDLKNLCFDFHTEMMRKLLFILAHYHGQVMNYALFATSLGITEVTVKKYISYLKNSFMIRELKPWFENISKRQVKTSKLYFQDSGIFHYLLGCSDYYGLLNHPKVGASFEGFVIEEIIKNYQLDKDDCYFWRSHNGAEIDLVVLKNGKKIGFEVKLSDAPVMTPSMKIALADLELDHIKVIYPGHRRYDFQKRYESCLYLN